MTNLKQDQKTMWMYAKNMDKDKTNMNMLTHTSKNNKVPVARLDCCFGTNRQSGQQEQTACKIIFMQDPMIHTLIYALVLELPYQM